jgi:hypothetical protein
MIQLLQRLRFGSRKPLVHVRSGFDLPRLPQDLVTDSARWKQLCFLPQSFRFVGKTFFEGLGLLETMSVLHALLPVSKAGARPAISSQTKATYRAVMA